MMNTQKQTLGLTKKITVANSIPSALEGVMKYLGEGIVLGIDLTKSDRIDISIIVTGDSE